MFIIAVREKKGTLVARRRGRSYHKNMHKERILGRGEREEIPQADVADYDFKEFGPAQIESMIAGDLLYFNRVRSIRHLFQGEAGALWDQLESEAKKAPEGETSPEHRRELFRRIEDFTTVLEEFEMLLNKENADARKKIGN